MDGMEPYNNNITFSIDLPKKGVLNGNLLFAAILSKMAYNRNDYVNVTFSDGIITPFDFETVKGIRFENSDVVAIIFTGSQTWKDWKSNLDIRKVKTHVGDVHSGFLNSIASIECNTVPFTRPSGENVELTSIKITVLPCIESLVTSNKPIVFGGHSRGGAQAQLVAALLHEKYKNVHSVYAFGSPKLGGPEWASWWKQAKLPLYNIRYGNDIVTEFPPSSFREAIWAFYCLLISACRLVTRKIFARFKRQAK